MGSANEKQRYNVTSSLIGQANTQNDNLAYYRKVTQDNNWLALKYD